MAFSIFLSEAQLRRFAHSGDEFAQRALSGPRLMVARSVASCPALLNSRRNDAYEAALATLREDTQGWWADELARDPSKLEDDDVPATADGEGLRDADLLRYSVEALRESYLRSRTRPSDSHSM
jgi:hypothetical protein